MIHKLKNIRITTIVFIFVILLVSYLVLKKQNIIDILYLICLIIYFIKYQIIQKKYKD